jgi:hypothetical protein
MAVGKRPSKPHSCTALVPATWLILTSSAALPFTHGPQDPIVFLINNGGYTIEVEIHDGEGCVD